jgi:hypothetical protein
MLVEGGCKFLPGRYCSTTHDLVWEGLKNAIMFEDQPCLVQLIISIDPMTLYLLSPQMIFRGTMHAVVDVSKRDDTVMKHGSLNIVPFNPALVK